MKKRKVIVLEEHEVFEACIKYLKKKGITLPEKYDSFITFNNVLKKYEVEFILREDEK